MTNSPETRLAAHKAKAARIGQDWREVARDTIRESIRNWKTNFGQYFEAYGFDKCRWIEKPAAIGLRRVGYADEIQKSNYAYGCGIDHTGWHTDDDGFDETVRGVVYQLPGRNGRAVYVSGYDDPHNDGPACLAFGRDITEGERLARDDGPSYDQGARDAAGLADGMAERMAEKERDYNRAWRAGSDAREALEEASDARRDLIETLQEARHERKASTGSGSLCKALQEWTRDKLEHIRDRQSLAHSLAADYGDQEGFADA